MLLIQTLFSVIYYIRRKVILSSMWWYSYFVCRVNRFRVMVDFVRDPNKFQIQHHVVLLMGDYLSA